MSKIWIDKDGFQNDFIHVLEEFNQESPDLFMTFTTCEGLLLMEL